MNNNLKNCDVNGGAMFKLHLVDYKV